MRNQRAVCSGENKEHAGEGWVAEGLKRLPRPSHAQVLPSSSRHARPRHGVVAAAVPLTISPPSDTSTAKCIVLRRRSSV